jgi:hypothetical protein
MKRLSWIAVALTALIVMALTPNSAAAGYPALRRISFAPGTISATRYDSLRVNGVDQWVLGISAGQTLTVNLVPMYGNARLNIVGADGTLLITDRAYAMFWTGQVPRTQDYYVEVIATNYSAPQYTLTVTIPPLRGPVPGPVPQRRNADGTWSGGDYIVELSQANGCWSAECPVTGRIIHITAGAPEIEDIQGSFKSNSGAVSFSVMIPGGQRFNGTVSPDSRTLAGTLSGVGTITLARQ